MQFEIDCRHFAAIERAGLSRRNEKENWREERRRIAMTRVTRKSKEIGS